jgi:hypothetical protein
LAGGNENEDEDEKQKRLHPGKTENEGIQRILPETVRQAGLILLFVGEVGPALRDQTSTARPVS